ncbi:MAG: T9SS type A sorting domain-containing protein [Ignavibacteriae bacterium]|nr:T9SS type A sorting domain-containing protein [Ignavibacteriota bacterium]MCB9244393.1 T9SS type A sorting domain-containing protein [Ignavibacteriales bacterium]
MKKILLLLVILGASDTYSQDTINAKFIPMHVGDYFVYKRYGINFSELITSRIIQENTYNGKRYFYFQGFPQLDNGYYRYDSTTGNFLQYRANSQCLEYPFNKLVDSLSSNAGDTLSSNNFCVLYEEVCTLRNDSIISFSHNSLTVRNTTYKKNIGIFTCCNGDPSCEVYYSFQGGIINGVLIGDTSLTSIENIGNAFPKSFTLYQNYPNPFNPSTSFKFEVPSSGNVTVSINDISGKLVTLIVNKYLSPGVYEVNWNAENYPSGVYFYSLEAEGFKETRKMLLIR